MTERLYVNFIKKLIAKILFILKYFFPLSVRVFKASDTIDKIKENGKSYIIT